MKSINIGVGDVIRSASSHAFRFSLNTIQLVLTTWHGIKNTTPAIPASARNKRAESASSGFLHGVG